MSGDFALSPSWFLCFVVIAMWCLVMGTLSVIGGWHALAATYPVRGEAAGEMFRFASMSLGRGFLPVNYGSCLSIRVGAQGMALSILFPFRCFHPPLFIPWMAVAECKHERHLFFTHTAVYLHTPNTRMLFSGRSGRAIYAQCRALGFAISAT